MRFTIDFIPRKRTDGRVPEPDELREHLAARGEWVALVRNQSAQGQRLTLFLNWRAVGGVLAASLVVVYLSAAVGLSWWLERNAYNRVHLADLMWPWRWSTLHDLRGQARSAEGLAALKADQAGRGIFLINLGLGSHPNDADTRLELARYYAKFHYYPGVLGAVKPQLEFPTVPHALIAVLLEEAARADDRETIRDVTAKLAARADVERNERRWLLLKQAEALLELHRPKDVLPLLADAACDGALETAELRVAALCALGKTAEALAIARAAQPVTAGRAPTGLPQPELRLLARALRAAGLPGELKTTLVQLIAHNPTLIEPRLFAIEQLWAAGLREDATHEVGVFLRRLNAAPNALTVATTRLAEAGALTLALVCLDEARALGQPVEHLWPVVLLAQIEAADWAGAERSFAAFFGVAHKSDDDELAMKDWFRAVLDAGRGASGEALPAAMKRRPLALAAVRKTAQGFAVAGNPEAVRVTLDAGLAAFPSSADLRRRAMENRQKLATWKPARKAVVAVEARPEPTGPDVSGLDAAQMTGRLEALLRNGEVNAGAALIAAVRRSEPDWLGDVQSELDWQEARIAFLREDRPLLTLLIGQNLRRHPTEEVRALDLARRYREEGDLVGARMVARKVAEILPDSEAARVFLEEIKRLLLTPQN